MSELHRTQPLVQRLRLDALAGTIANIVRKDCTDAADEIESLAKSVDAQQTVINTWIERGRPSGT